MSKNEKQITAVRKERIDPETLAKCYEVVDRDEEGNPIYQLKEKYRNQEGLLSFLRGFLP